jgi:hypothetical protein
VVLGSHKEVAVEAGVTFATMNFIKDNQTCLGEVEMNSRGFPFLFITEEFLGVGQPLGIAATELFVVNYKRLVDSKGG